MGKKFAAAVTLADLMGVLLLYAGFVGLVGIVLPWETVRVLLFVLAVGNTGVALYLIKGRIADLFNRR